MLKAGTPPHPPPKRNQPLMPEAPDEPVSYRHDRPDRGRGHGHRRRHRGDPVVFPPRQGPGGALAASYDIPAVSMRRRRARSAVAAAVVLASAGVARHVLLTWDYRAYRPLLTAWSLAFVFSAVQWL